MRSASFASTQPNPTEAGAGGAPQPVPGSLTPSAASSNVIEATSPDVTLAERPSSPSPARRTADRPHTLTIVLSSLAIVVSLASFFQSRHALDTTESVARAAVQASTLRLARAPQDLPFLQVDLTLTNFGQRIARDVKTRFEWDVTDVPVPTGTPTYEQPQQADLAPKNTRTIRLQANRRFSGGNGLSAGPGLNGPKSQLLVYGVTDYADESSGKRYHDVWCFSFDPKDPKQAASLELKTCTYQPSEPAEAK